MTLRPLRKTHRTLRETYAGQHLLVTGVTGFLGKVWLAMVLDRLDTVDRVTVLIRGKKGASAEERFEKIVASSPALRPLREKHGVALWDLVAQKIQVVDAQLTRPLCGLEDPAALLADVDCVVHFAGLTDFEPDPQQAIDANIHGASHVADLAALTPSKRYVHVSTTFVAGMRQGEVAEAVTPGISPTGVAFDPRAELAALEAALDPSARKKDRVDVAMKRAQALGWPNIYTFTKALSEHLLEERTDVRTTTFRPAIVECARSYPFEGWNEGINTSGPLVWLLSTSFRRLPARKNVVFDVVPVDTVARSMVVVVGAALRDDAEPVYQCASGHLNPLRFERAIDLTGLAVRKLHQHRGDWFERNVVRRLDAHSVDPDRPQVLGYKRVRQAAKATRAFLRDFDLERALPATVYERIDGEKRKEELRSFSMKCRTNDRKLGQIDEMLRQYRPFIHDHSYTFRTDRLAAENLRLAEEDTFFAFDVEDICWREYWVKVQVPGLDTWTVPLLRGEKVPDDAPLPKHGERETGEFARDEIDAAIEAGAKKTKRDKRTA